MRKPQQVKHDSRRAVMARIEGVPADRKAEAMCQEVGHSRIVLASAINPYNRSYHCARCDRLCDLAPESVIVGSKATRENRAKLAAMTWKDKLYAPSNPLTTETF